MSVMQSTNNILATAIRQLEGSFRLDQLVALSGERALYRAWDLLLKRAVALKVHLLPGSPEQAWFLRETETLAALNHPAIRHVYAAGHAGAAVYRTASWVDGESLAEAMGRGPRPFPTVLALVRDLLGALEHAHGRGIILRRIGPVALMIDLSGRAVVTDLRHANWSLAHALPEPDPGHAFMAPEIRNGGPGEPAADVYAVAALVYYALTGREPATAPGALVAPRQLRSTIPQAVERVLLRALSERADARYLTATEMLEDFARDAGVFHEPAAAPALGDAGFERRLRRALGDDYELLEEIGSGGFGRVYRVRDLGLEREVAIKVLHPALTANPGVVERFRTEAQLAGRLRHPNVVGIYEIDERAGLLWYTMELVPGSSLAQVVQRQGPLPADRVVRLVDEALSALEQAHRLGLVHRDLKPENMLIEPDGRLRITDFGLALALRGESRFGGATSRSGTPQFAAPEQLLGDRVDQRTDLYSLGATAYFALLGRPPFEGTTPEAILAGIATTGPPLLSERRSDVRAEFEAWLRTTVANDPGQRFESATAAREALHRATRRLLGRVAAWLSRA
jgi:serine/threonine protein kinase